MWYGRAAAGFLTSEEWSGRCVRELHGPADLCFNDVAQVLSQVIGRKVTFFECSVEQARKAMLDNGMSENATELMLELYEAVDSGRCVSAQPRSAESTTPTRLADFVHEVIVPLIPEATTR